METPEVDRGVPPAEVDRADQPVAEAALLPGGRERVGAAIAGSALLGFGCYLAYRNPSGTPVAALVVIGAVVLASGAIGNRVYDLRWFRMGRIAAALWEEAATAGAEGDNARAERLSDLATQVATRAPVVRQVSVSGLADALEYQQDVIEALRQGLPSGWVKVGGFLGRTSHRFAPDAMLEQGAKRIGVETVREIRSDRLLLLVERLRQAGYDGGLIVAKQDPARRVPRLSVDPVSEFPHRLVVWAPDESPAELLAAARNLLA